MYEPKRRRGIVRFRIEKWLEKTAIDRASKILVITDYNVNKYKDLYQIPDSKIEQFQIGCWPVFKQSDRHGASERGGRFLKLVYGGSLDAIHRNPIPFLDALCSLSDVRLDVFNEDLPSLQDNISERRLEGRVSVYQLLSPEEFQSVMNQYDALVLFGNKTPFQVPGKVFSYIETGMHIIYIKNNDSNLDGTEEVLKKYGNYSLAKNNSESIMAAIQALEELGAGKASLETINRFNCFTTMQPIVDAVNDACVVAQDTQ